MLFEYGLDTESQLFALDLTPLEKKRKRGGKDKYDTENELRLKVNEFQVQTQNWFEEAVYSGVEVEEEEDALPRRKEEHVGSGLERSRLQLASAIYFVTYYSEAAKNKDKVLALARSLGEGDQLERLISKRKKEAEEKEKLKLLFMEEMNQLNQD